MAAKNGVEVAKAFVTILPSMPGVQKKINAAFGNAAGKSGQKAGEDAGEGFGEGVERGMSGLAGTFKGIAGAASVALGSIAFGSIVSEAVEASDATKKFRSTLDFAGLGSKEIDKVTKSVQAYADKTVYDLADIQNMTAQLAANGVPNYEKLAEAAGNLNAVAGGNAETFKSVGMVMTQTAGAGKLTTENWNQLSDAIPGASGKLQEAMKKNGAYTGNFRDAMEKGEISADEFNKAVMQLGQNDGAKKAASSTSTFEGAWGNLKAAVNKGVTAIVDKAMPRITDALNKLSDFAPKAFDGLNRGLDTAKKGFDWFIRNGEVIGGALSGIAGGFIAIKVAAGISAAVGAFKGLLGAVKGAGSAMGLLKGVVAALGGPFVIAAAAIGAVSGALIWFFTQTETGQKAWKQFTDFLSQSMQTLMQWWGPIWEQIKAKFQEFTDFLSQSVQQLLQWWAPIWEQIKVVFKQVWESIKPIASDALGQVWVFIQEILPQIQAIWKDGWEFVKTAFKAAWDFIKTYIVPLLSAIVGFIRDNMDNIKTIWDGVWTVIQTVVGAVWAAIKNTITTMLGVIRGVIKTMTALIKGDWSGVWNGIKMILSSVWTGMKNSVSIALNAMFGVIRGMLGIIKGVFSTAWNGIKQIMAGVWTWISQHVITSFKNGLGSLGRAMQSMRDMAAKAWNGLKSAAATPVRWVVNVVYTNGIQKVWNGIAGAVGLNKLKLPDAKIKFARGGVMPGYTPGRDVMMAAVSGGEAIMRPEFTRAVGKRRIDEWNRLARTGGATAVRSALSGLPHYANGGVVSSSAAISNAMKATKGWAGMCLKFVQDMFHAAARFPSAISAWNGSTQKHPTSDPSSIPAGVPVYFSPHGTPWGHVALSLGNGMMRTTNSGDGRIHTDPISQWVSYGYKLLGWTSDIEGQAIPGVGQAKATGGGLLDKLSGFLAGPAEWVKSRILTPVTKMIGKIGSGNWGKIIGQLPINLAKGLIGKATDAAKNLAGMISGNESGGSSGTGGVERWRSLVNQALTMLGQPTSWADTVLRRMNQESGGNPTIVNNWDSNAKAGTPSKGLMQVIQPTFDAYAGPLRSRGILDPLANIYAGLNYAIHRYGSLSALNGAGGYKLGGVVPMLANGGTVVRPGVSMVGEKGPELLRLPVGAQVRPLTDDGGSDDATAEAVMLLIRLLPGIIRDNAPTADTSGPEFQRSVIDALRKRGALV